MLLFITFALAAGDPAAGQVIYSPNCTACHGQKADGKGPAAVALKPKPTDFTAPAFWASRKDEDVAGSIRAGKPGTAMSAFAQLSEADVANIVAYLRSVAAPAAPPPPATP